MPLNYYNAELCHQSYYNHKLCLFCFLLSFFFFFKGLFVCSLKMLQITSLVVQVSNVRYILIYFTTVCYIFVPCIGCLNLFAYCLWLSPLWYFADIINIYRNNSAWVTSIYNTCEHPFYHIPCTVDTADEPPTICKHLKRLQDTQKRQDQAN